MKPNTKQLVLRLTIALVILPVLTESIYAPCFPLIARSLHVSEAQIQQGFSWYLLFMAIGPLLWGQISDYSGRRPLVILGMVGFSGGSLLGCYVEHMSDFIIALCLQAFFGSVICLAQPINRDVFTTQERVEVSSWIGSIVSVAPAVGALLGGGFALYGNWRDIFVLLSIAGVVWVIAFATLLPETKPSTRKFGLSQLLLGSHAVLTDGNLLGYAALIGLGLGLMYSFFAEGPFYFAQRPQGGSWFAWICALGALSYALGCRYAHRRIESGISCRSIMTYGLYLQILGSLGMMLWVWFGRQFLWNSLWGSSVFFLGIGSCWLIVSVGISMLLTPAFALALEHQAEHAGVAGSWLSGFYNGITSLSVWGVSQIGTENLMHMPLYFTCLSVIACIFLYTLHVQGVLCEHSASVPEESFT